MRAWAYWIRDNITLIYFGAVLALFVVAWLVIEAVRAHASRDEIFRLRQRLYELEHERHFGRAPEAGPVVMASRWVRTGSAATTSDGGCLILIEAVSPYQKRASLTLRVDGLPARSNEALAVGECVEVPGKSGTYVIELHAADKSQARLAVTLRPRHAEAI